MSTASPSVALRFREYQDVAVIPYNNNEDYRQLSLAMWVHCDTESSMGNDPCYLLAKKGSFALGLRSDEIAMAFHNKAQHELATPAAPPQVRHSRPGMRSDPVGSGWAVDGGCPSRAGRT